MKSKVDANIHFIGRQARSKTETYLYIRITVEGRRSEKALGYTVDSHKWDRKQQRLKGNSMNLLHINRVLDDIRVQFNELIFDCAKNDKLITLEMVEATLFGEEESPDKMKLIELIDYHNEMEKDRLSWGTLKNYYSTKKYIALFLQHAYKQNDIYIKNLDYKFLTSFERYLRSCNPIYYKKMANNTVMKHIDRLRKVVRMAVRYDWLDKDPFKNFQKKLVKNERGYLTAHELQKIENARFQKRGLETVRRIFVFACYTGLSYSDLMGLTFDHIQMGIDGHQWINMQRAKTAQSFRVPLLAPALRIINYFQEQDYDLENNRVLPFYTNQPLNRYLKMIAKDLDIHKNISCHIARHTFATTVTLTNGVPLETVSKLLGHTKLRTTQIYAKIIDKKITDDTQVLHEIYGAKSTQRINSKNIL